MKLSVNFLISSIVLSTANLAAARNEKKGVAFNGAQACSTLEPHTDSSWWYSWGLSTGFSGKWNFCDADAQVVHPADAARADGMEFVPMFWNSVPDPNSLDADTIANMQAASHVMGFNEPELPAQANLSPSDAAAMWADVVDIAGQYNLNIVGPCMTKDGFSWYDEWLSECNALYPGVGCHHDVVCIHMYQNPHPCDTSKPWECIGDETGNHAKNYLNRWYNDYGNKPIWVTEYGCYPWTSEGCDASKHAALMDQLTSIFESPEFTDKVERYNWFTTYASDPQAFGSGALNVPNWESVGDAVGCPNKKWLANVYPRYSWGIKEIHECVDLAKSDPSCHSPLVLSMDDGNCYCSTDSCDTVEATWGGMKTFRELMLQTPEASSLSQSGEQYNNFAIATDAPTKEPTPAPVTPSPTVPLVSCGGHYAPSCSDCPQGNGAFWCNGECKWENNQCVPESHVNCGGHSAPTCADCPAGNGALWCNGECSWENGECIDATCQDSPLGWYDSDGPYFNCDWYAVDNRCQLYGNFYQNFGATANQACCGCGGGV